MDGLMLLLLICVFLCLLELARKKERVKKAWQAFEAEAGAALAGARFALDRDLRRAGWFKRGGEAIRVGFSPERGRPIFYNGSGHLLAVCGARWGKLLYLLAIALMTFTGSVAVVDPKMELLAVTGRYRRRFGPVYVLDPFRMRDDMPEAVRGLRCVGFNPLAGGLLNVDSPNFHADCDRIASACVWDETGEGHHFATAARILVSGVIAAVARHGKPEERNLATVARIISGGLLIDFCGEVVSKTKDPDIIAKLGRFAHAKADNKEVQDVIATAITQLAFISGPVAKHLADPDSFDPAVLRTKRGASVYKCVPLNRLDTHGEKIFRLLTESELSSLLSVRKGKRSRVLMIVDEMAQLGPKMKSLENAMGMAAGACGLTIWCVLQDISQLQGMFPKTWQTFIQNCGVTMWGRARDPETRRVISLLGGTTTVMSRSRNLSFDQRTGEPIFSHGAGEHSRPLIHEYEAGELPPDRMYLFGEKIDGPVKAKLKPYTKCGFSGYGKNPYFQKRGGLTGWLFG
jgi:type IV secretion system protein VirD4